jgi:hypothetical protein
MKTILFILICAVGLTATVSGLLMISGPDGAMLGLPLSLLDQTPFRSFLIPGIILAFLVGGVNLIAVFFNIQRNANRYNWAIAGGILITGWIIVQIILIQTVHWLHFLYLGMGALIILLAYQLKGKWAV